MEIREFGKRNGEWEIGKVKEKGKGKGKRRKGIY
jgi:hypothetical protein